MKKLSIIIVNWNSSDLVKQCILSIDQAKKTKFILENVIIVDNASRESEVEQLKRIQEGYDWISVYLNKTNLGFAKACNFGANKSDADYYLFLNPDTVLFQDTLDLSIAAFEKHRESVNKAAVLGCRLLDEHGNTQRCCSRFPKLRYYLARCLGVNHIIKPLNQFMVEWDHEESKYVDEVMGAYFLTDAEVFRQLKGFDERFFVYYEEVDYCKRIINSGQGVYYYSNASIFHEAGGSSNQVKAERLFYEWRSRYQYQDKYGSKCGLQLLRWITYLEHYTRRIQMVLKGRKEETYNITRAYHLWKKWYHDTNANT